MTDATKRPAPDPRPEHHPLLPPSSFPMFAECPCYVSGDSGDAAESGARQHRLLAASLAGAEPPADRFGCDDGECDQVEWAARYIRLHTGAGRLVEERMTLPDGAGGEVTFGTLDVVDHDGGRLAVIDYKSGDDHGYLPQMAVYARMAMLRFGADRCETHELYGRLRRVKRYVLELADTAFVHDIAAAVPAPSGRPRLNGFCAWCAKQGECPETTAAIVTVAAEYEPESAVARLPLSAVRTWHASRIADPREMAVVLDVADYLGAWARAVRQHAKTAAMKGMDIPGYALRDGRGNRAFADVAGAFRASGLSLDEFLACCSASVPDVERAMAAKRGAVGAAAKKAFAAVMGGLIIRKPAAPVLTKGRACPVR